VAEKNPLHRLIINKTDIFIGGSPDWTATALQTTWFLKKNLAPQETFFALPYDIIYYFLTERKSPTLETVFFDYMNVPEKEERHIIVELEKKKINYVLLSNRIAAKEEGLGTFGKTYCPLLADYINKNFVVVKTFGDWVNEPGWAWNYGTKVLKRKSN